MKKTPEEKIVNFGVVAGVCEEPGRLLAISEFAEKPNLEYARTNLRVEGLKEGEYLTIFGQYIVKPQIFDYLEEHIANNVRERGEFQLTSCLDRLRQEDGFLGYILEGRRYDIGLPESYLETLNAFRTSNLDPTNHWGVSAAGDSALWGGQHCLSTLVAPMRWLCRTCFTVV